ncbi:hypothetical protein ACOME3_003425 [Neoechinorhynchus agilis]
MSRRLSKVPVEFITKIKASSTLDRDEGEADITNVLDDDECTCWQSDQGQYQYIDIRLNKSIVLRRIELMFHNGFMCKLSRIVAKTGSDFFNLVSAKFTNSDCLQVIDADNNTVMSEKYRIYFEQCEDMFNRIILYKMTLYTEENELH